MNHDVQDTSHTVQNFYQCLFMVRVQLLVTLCEIISPYWHF